MLLNNIAQGLDSVAGNALVLYLLWWIPYVCFMLLVGIDLPKKFKYDGTPKNPKWDTGESIAIYPNQEYVALIVG